MLGHELLFPNGMFDSPVFCARAVCTFMCELHPQLIASVGVRLCRTDVRIFVQSFVQSWITGGLITQRTKRPNISRDKPAKPLRFVASRFKYDTVRRQWEDFNARATRV